MSRWRMRLVFCLLITLASCDYPTFSQSKREKIAVEARELMRRWPTKTHVVVPNERLQPTLAGLHPDFVMVRADGVDIVTTAYFDGGWGYYVLKSARPTSDELFRHRSLGHGVYWFHPY